MRKLKYFTLFSFILSLLVPSSWAQESQWPWVKEGENFQIATDPNDSFSPAIASACKDNSCFYLVVWSRKTSSGYDIYGVKVNQDGTIEDTNGIPICTAPNDQMFPAVASDGENFLVVWQDMRSGKRWDIYGARVTAEGEVFDKDIYPDGFLIATEKSTYDQVSPSLAFDGENYWVVWQGKRKQKLWNIYFTQVPKVPIGGEMMDERPEKTLLVPSPKNQISPSLAFNGESLFIVWQDFRNGKFWDIYGTRVTRLGKVLDLTGIQITFSDEMGGNRWRPILSWNGNYYMVIWTVSPESGKWCFHGQRVGKEGEIYDLFDLPIMEGGLNKAFPIMLWDGSEFLFIWEEEPEGETKILGTSIVPDYRPWVREWVQISSPDSQNPSRPAIAIIGSEALVVWQGKGPDSQWKIHGQRLSKLMD